MTEREKYLLNQRAKALLTAMADMKKSIPYDCQDQWDDAAAHMCSMVKRLCPGYLRDKDMVIGTAISGGLTGIAVEKMPEGLRRDHEVAATILNCHVELLESDRKAFLAPFVDDQGLMLAALDAGMASYSDVSPRLRADADIACASIDRNDPFNSLSQFPPELFSDLDFVLSALDVADPAVVELFLPDNMRRDPAVRALTGAASRPATPPPGYPGSGRPAPGLDAMIASAQDRAGTGAEDRGHPKDKAAEL